MELFERLEKSSHSRSHRGGDRGRCPGDPGSADLPAGIPGVGGGVQPHPYEPCQEVPPGKQVKHYSVQENSLKNALRINSKTKFHAY